jgi:AcrR family transcriptional regulator
MSQEAARTKPKQLATRRKRGNFINRKEEVLRVAARLFSESGYRQATLEDVASALDITRPALYHYAKSKDELAKFCSEIAEDLIREAISSALRHHTGREQLVAFFRRYAEIICDDFGRCFVLVRREEYGPEQQERNRRDQREIDQSIREMVAKGVEDGSLKSVDPAYASRVLFGAFNGIPVWYRPNAGRAPSQIAEDFLVILLKGLAPQVDVT